MRTATVGMLALIACYAITRDAAILETIIALMVIGLVIVIPGIVGGFNRNYHIIRTGYRGNAPEITTAKAEIIPGDIAAIKQGIPAIIRAIGPGRLALPAASPDGPQSPGAGHPPVTGNGNGPGPQSGAPGAA